MLQTIWTVNPGAVAVSECSPIVGFAPSEQAAGGVLLAVADGVVALVLQALADDAMTNEVAQRRKAEHELAIRIGVDGRSRE